MLFRLSAAEPLLVSVMFFAALVVRTFCAAKVRLVGEMEAEGPPVVPVPDKPTDCGLPLALSVTRIDAVRVPAALGVNKTLMAQFPPAGTDGVQLFDCEKSPALVPVMVTLATDNEVLPVLNSVTPPAGLVVPTLVLPKVMVLLLKLTVAAVPIPVRDAVCGLPEALSMTVMLAWRVPAAAGVNSTLIEQLVPSAREDPQVLVWAKSPLFVPVTPIELMVNVALPVLLRVSTLSGPLVPTGSLAKVILVGDNDATGAMPVPMSGTVCGLPEALSLTVTLAVRMPDAVGAKIVLMEQDAPAATDAPQLLVCEKSPGLVPPSVMLLMVSTAPPVLVSTTTPAALDVPTV